MKDLHLRPFASFPGALSVGSAASELIPLDFVRFGPDGDQQSRGAAIRRVPKAAPSLRRPRGPRLAVSESARLELRITIVKWRS